MTTALKAKARPDNGMNRIIVYRHGECIGPHDPRLKCAICVPTSGM